MARKAGRSSDQTRRQVLDAAAAVIRRRGVGATLDEIARAAGVSKGGLVYHFASKEELLRAIVTDHISAFREAVETALDPDDSAPGRLTRAYVRASLADDQDEHEMRDVVALSAELNADPAVGAAIRADADRWLEELRADGLPEDVMRLVVAAADGASTAPLWGAGDDAVQRERTRRQLIALTHDPEPLGALLEAADRSA